MSRAARLICAGLLALLGALACRADIDPAEYELKRSVRSEQERRRLEAQFEKDRAREVEKVRREAEQEALRIAAARAAWEALPFAQRLTQTRCTGCHLATNYENQRHNRLGWELVVLRMQHLNKAPLQDGERGIIAAHLAERLPVTGWDAAWEALQQLTVALLPLWVWLCWRLWSLRHRQSGISG